MSEYLKFFKGDVTAGQKDGVEISTGDFQNPIAFDLNLTAEQTGYVKLAVRCEDGYAADGDVELEVKYKTVDNSDAAVAMVNRYTIAVDEGYDEQTAPGGTYASRVSIQNLADTNKLFWLKCTSSKDEAPSVDKNCVLHAEAMIKSKTETKPASTPAESSKS